MCGFFFFFFFFFFLGGGGGPVQGWGGGQSGCKRRIDVILKMHKKRKEKRLG